MLGAASASNPELTDHNTNSSLTTVTELVADDSAQNPSQAYRGVIKQFKHYWNSASSHHHVSTPAQGSSENQEARPQQPPENHHSEHHQDKIFTSSFSSSDPNHSAKAAAEAEQHEQGREPHLITSTTKSGSNHFFSKWIANRSLNSSADEHAKIDWLNVLPNRFPGTPSPLFLQMYAEAVKAVIAAPESAVLSPSLLSSSGKVTLTIVSIIPDIMQYHHDAIITAKSEVLLATNAWEMGPSVSQISSALLELNRRAGEENRRIQVKILIDTASLRNVVQSRFYRKSNTWPKIGLPAIHEIPHLTLEVMNYHVAPLGTFHSKFAVIDRKFALLCSNNVNLRCNLEMMVRLEGDIVNSLYDTFLISWGQNLHEPLHFGQQVVVHGGGASCQPDNGTSDHDPSEQSSGIQDKRKEEQDQQELFSKFSGMNSDLHSGNLNEHLNVMESASLSATSPEDHLEEYTPFFHHYSSYEEQEQDAALPMCLVNRPPYSIPGHGDVVNPQNNVWLAAFAHAQHHVFVQSPVFNASPLMDAVIEACKRDVQVELWTSLGFNDFAESNVPFQGGTNSQFADKLFKELIPLNKDMNLHYHYYVAKDQNVPHRFEDFTRNCHVKFMAVDQQVCVVGSGNMDTQSWFHSQEVNVMVDSCRLAKQWREHVFEKNQNTYRYGRIDGRKTTTLLHSGEALPQRSKGGGISRAKGGFLYFLYPFLPFFCVNIYHLCINGAFTFSNISKHLFLFFFYTIHFRQEYLL